MKFSKNLKSIIKKLSNGKHGNLNKVFCISMQRTGTTSVGDFFKNFDYNVARSYDSRRNQWSKSWYDGDFETIFKSKEFLSYQVFEDDPWWHPEFYKILYHRFPNSKFILFIRDSNSWYKSMVSHSNGMTLGNTKTHCKHYRREKDYYEFLETNKNIDKNELDEHDNLLELASFEQQYKQIYEIRNKEVIDFFDNKNPKCLFVCNLNDENKWKKLGEFIGINIPENFEIHSNKSTK